MNIWTWLALCMGLCAVGAAFGVLLPSRHVPRIVACIGAGCGLILAGVGGCSLYGVAADRTLWNLPPIGDLAIRVDPLSGLFLLVTGLVFLAASIYAANSLERLVERYDLRGFAAAYFGLLAWTVWLLVAADTFSFLLAWELMSLFIYFLVSFEHEESERTRASFLMLAMGEAGALAAAVGMLVLAAAGHSLTFSDMKVAGMSLGTGARWTVFLLTFFGFGAKAGLLPFNFWLPDAYAASPAAFAPVLAGATMNLGLYGIFRFNADLLPPANIGPGVVALVVGTLSALIGILYATTSNDMKKVLAHSSIENAGLIAVGFGAGSIFAAAGKPALAAMAFLVALYHMINHSLFKSLLFIGCGAVEDGAATRDLDRLGGLIRRMPKTSLCVLAGVLSIAALPPFNGFVSEWLTLQYLLRSAEMSDVGVKIVFALCGAALALTAALAVTCFAKFFAMGFLGMARSPAAEEAREVRRPALSAMGILAFLCLALGVLPTYTIAALDHAVLPMTGSSAVASLVPPFFAGAPGRAALPAGFAAEFHDLGAEVGEGVLPAPGLVIMHRGGTDNPVVFAGAPSYLCVVLAGLLLVVFVSVRLIVARRRTVVRGACWDGGIRRLLPEMTYTATGFSNPVRVIFQAILRPTSGPDSWETVAQHFRTAIHRHTEEVHIVDRYVRQPLATAAMIVARLLAHLHRGRLNAYLAYVLAALLVALLVDGWFCR